MPYAVSPEQRVNAYTNSRQSAPQTLALPDGGYVVVWSGAGQPDQGYGVYLQRFDASGARVGGEILVNTTIVQSQRTPQVTLLASGGYAVTWDSTVPGGGAGDPATLGVFVQAFDANGARVGGETQVSGSGYYQRIAALDDGGYVVSWTHTYSPSSGVMARRYDAAGQALGPAFVLDQDMDANWADIAATDTGFIAVWRAYNDGVATIAVQSFGLDGARQGETVRIPRDGESTMPEIVALADGGFVLVWREATGLYAQLLGEDGRPAADRFLVQAASSGSFLHTVAATPDGGFVIAWDRFASGATVAQARAFFADGRPNGDLLTIGVARGSDGDPPGITVLASGDIILTYARYSGNITDFHDVFQVRLEPDVRTLRGSEAGDNLTGGAGTDHLLGLDGNDTLTGGRGHDVLDGGAGLDTAVFAGDAEDYVIFETADGFRIKGQDGSDLLKNIEFLRFDDRTLDLSLIVCDPGTGQPATQDEGPQVLPSIGGGKASDAVQDPLVLPGFDAPPARFDEPAPLPGFERLAPQDWE